MVENFERLDSQHQLDEVMKAFSEADEDGTPDQDDKLRIIRGLVNDGAISTDIANLASGWMEDH